MALITFNKHFKGGDNDFLIISAAESVSTGEIWSFSQPHALATNPEDDFVNGVWDYDGALNVCMAGTCTIDHVLIYPEEFAPYVDRVDHPEFDFASDAQTFHGEPIGHFEKGHYANTTPASADDWKKNYYLYTKSDVGRGSHDGTLSKRLSDHFTSIDKATRTINHTWDFDPTHNTAAKKAKINAATGSDSGPLEDPFRRYLIGLGPTLSTATADGAWVMIMAKEDREVFQTQYHSHMYFQWSGGGPITISKQSANHYIISLFSDVLSGATTIPKYQVTKLTSSSVTINQPAGYNQILSLYKED